MRSKNVHGWCGPDMEGRQFHSLGPTTGNAVSLCEDVSGSAFYLLLFHHHSFVFQDSHTLENLVWAFSAESSSPESRAEESFPCVT